MRGFDPFRTQNIQDDKDLTGPEYQKETFWAFILASGAGGLGNNLTRAVVGELSKEAFLSVTERFLIRLGLREAARSSILRIIPLAGLFLAGGLNYWFGKTIGERALHYYEGTAQLKK